MSIDYSAADQVFELSFAKLDRANAPRGFPEPGKLASIFSALIGGSRATTTLTHQQTPMLASSSIEMWHRAVHSFLWSVALTESSPIWASNSGYYASHFVMRAFAHSIGIFKSFTRRTAVQILVQNGGFVWTQLSVPGGEHAFYWKAVKGHPRLISDPLFRENNERENNRNEDQSDALHRNFATYTDHVDSFTAPTFPSIEEVSQRIEQISRIRRHSVVAPTPQRGRFPDINNVQILAFQRIVAFHDFLDERVPTNRFWRAHRRPIWCRDVMPFQVEDRGMEQPSVT
jgi:hypothetical protein